jgi:protein-disulfide isomerase
MTADIVRRARLLLVAGGLAGALAIGALSATRSSTAAASVAAPQGGTDPRAFEQWYRTQPRVTVPVAAAGAAVVIVKFTDYQCPACANTHFTFTPALAKYAAQVPGAVVLVSKHFPLNADCNPALAGPLHPAACEAAAAVELARTQGRATAMEDWLYANHAALTPVSIRQAAFTVGRVPDMAAGYRRALDAVRADAALGRLLGVTQTPTFFINGVKVARQTVLQPEELEVAIRYELQRTSGR